VARALEPLPRISAAMACGRLSYSKVRALTRVATPETEEVLLNVALHGTTHHVETLVRQFRRVQEVQELEREAQQYAQRGLTYFHDADGSLVVKLRLTAEGGAVFLKAMAAALPEIPLPRDDDGRKAANSMGSAEHRQPALHVSAETRCALPGSRTFDGRVPTPAARRADALVVLAESFLQFGVAAMKGGDRHQIVVHVDDCTLRRGEAGRCELDEGPGIPVQTARRLACDASIVTITEDERGDPLDVGRKTRSIPPALRRALASRDKGCVFPGCTHTRYVDGHHIRHWADGGETRLSNLVTLCRFHHRAVHEGGLQVERCDDGAWRFTNPRGESLLGCSPGHTAPLAHWTQVVQANEQRGLQISARTAATGWRGERMDYGIAIDALLYRTARAGGAASGPSTDSVSATTPDGHQRHCTD
jgi:hypothetical protein